jgi:DNA-binding MarR family transcriptional regulator
MLEAYVNRQHDVNIEGLPRRTPAGEAFTELVLEVAWLGGIFSDAGERLASRANQSLARWVVLEAVADAPATVASIARRRGIARQAVQRVAHLLVRDGLATYITNPVDRRAQLLELTPRGGMVLQTIAKAQKGWADGLGAELGEAKLREVAAAIGTIRKAVSARKLGGAAHRRHSLRVEIANESDNPGQLTH